MKNIIRKNKDWMIGKLGGYTKEDIGDLYKSQVAARKSMLQAYENDVQEICRRSDNSYYDWYCEFCRLTCEKRDGRCQRFAPIVAAESEVTGCESSADL